MDLDAFQERLGYRFRDVALLEQALTHPSLAKEAGTKDNQRLEFMGDAVIDLIASRILFDAFPDASEGELSRRRALMISQAALAAIGRKLEIHALIRIGNSHRGMKTEETASVMADAVEAVVCAVFCDSDYAQTDAVFSRWLVIPADIGGHQIDPKSRLQEWVQKRRAGLPVYTVLAVSGPAHEREYVVSVAVEDVVKGQGAGRTKKEAERNAALAALEGLQHA
jgi:ribonuclease-3